MRIQFYDNQPCIDTIEDRLGIIDLLDEQCKVGMACMETNNCPGITKLMLIENFETFKVLVEMDSLKIE